MNHEAQAAVQKAGKKSDLLKSLRGRSLPSVKYGAWIVAEVSNTMSGRSRLVSGNLKAEQWVWTSELVSMFERVDAWDALDTELNRKLRSEP